jgi:hypothetical protein
LLVSHLIYGATIHQAAMDGERILYKRGKLFEAATIYKIKQYELVKS